LDKITLEILRIESETDKFIEQTKKFVSSIVGVERKEPARYKAVEDFANQNKVVEEKEQVKENTTHVKS